MTATVMSPSQILTNIYTLKKTTDVEMATPSHI